MIPSKNMSTLDKFHKLALSSEQVKSKIQSNQSNNFELPTRSYWDIIRDNVFNPINNILFAIFALLIFMGKYSDSVIYITVAIINIVVAVYQEIQSKRKLDQITFLTKPKAKVIRTKFEETQEEVIDPLNIVLDDIVVASLGDQILVDGVVIEGKADVDESQLTGESEQVKKRVNSEISSGSFVTSGKLIYQATRVGINSTVNQLALQAKTIRVVSTPLQVEINSVVKVLISVVLFFLSLALLRSFLENNTGFETITMVAVIVGIVPHSLFMMMTLAYGLGAVRMLKKGAMVQQLNAVESLSNIDVLCLDKTGTLTTNEIYLDQVVDINSNAVTGNSLDSILSQYSSLVTIPNKTMEALQSSVKQVDKFDYEVISEVDFDSKRKWSALSWQQTSSNKTYSKANGQQLNIVIGAPDVLFDYQKSLSNDDLQKTISNFSNSGKRVLMVAFAPNLDSDKMLLGESLQVLGLIIMADKLRLEAKEIIQYCYDLGVKVKIISGDNPQSVSALAKQVNVVSQGMISGIDLLKYSDAELEQRLPEIVSTHDIFGRVTPEQKKMLIQAIKKTGSYVAMTGDGVNDVPALKVADLAISMESGSQAARNIADIVLLNDSFSSIPTGFMEGQKIRSGMQDILALYLGRIFYTSLIIVSIMVIGAGFPLAIKHSSLIGMFCAAIPTILLTLIAVPKKTAKTNLLKSQLQIILPIGLIVGVTSVLIYAFFYTKLGIETKEIPFNRNMIGQIKDLNINSISGLVQDKIEYTARSFMVLFILFVGIWNVVVVSPPNNHRPNPFISWLPTILSTILTLVVIMIYSFPVLARFFDLQPMAITPIMIILLASILCNALVYLAWKNDWTKPLIN
jgi:cation-transporting P-type ATPase E